MHYTPFTSKEIKPRGWLLRQLLLQAQGLAGNLDKVWPDVRDSAWIGGSAEGWERVPYWLDGFVPLAYLLDDEDMIARAKKYIDAILAGQKENGWLCPCDEENIAEYDTWALLLISKVLVGYYRCSDDERVPDALYRALKNYHALLKSGAIRLFKWGQYRWFEGFIAIRFLYERCHEEWLIDLAKILHAQGTNYNQLTGRWERALNQWSLDTHIVNIAMMLKSEAVSWDLLGREYENNAEKLYQLLREYHGAAVGIFTGDECLSGLSPIQGTELCAVVEQMYSYEQLFERTGNPVWLERLEKLAFNALPATISDDMWAHQYVQMSNQISCQRFPGRSLFRTNGPEAHLFGLEPNYGCCTANMGQGWPKFALSAFYEKDDVLYSALGVPCSLSCKKADVTLDSDYPFLNEWTYHVKAHESFTLRIRKPSFVSSLTVDSKPIERTEPLVFPFEAGEEKDIHIVFDITPKMVDRPGDMKVVRCGSLFFSLPVEYEKVPFEYEKNGVERRFPYCDYEYVGKSAWNYAFASEQFDVIRTAPGAVPFSSKKPPVVMRTVMRPIPWEMEDGFETVCARTPGEIEKAGDREEKLLHPYGCAKLRMTEMPLV